MRTPRRRLAIPSALLLSLLCPRRALAAEPSHLAFALHAEGAAAHMVGEGKAEEFGWGVAGLLAPELRFSRHVGVELAVGGVGLTDGAETPPGYAPTEEGSALVALPGLRLRPFGAVSPDTAVAPSGLWVAAGGGVAHTGGLTRPAVDARIGFDLHGSTISAGPFVGLWQVVEPDDGVRPEDGRVALAGLHATLDTARAKRASTDDGDRDRDGISNATDACPDGPEDKDGFEDKDGCPETDNDRDGIVDDRDVCPNDAEDVDEFQDEDGCAETDNDRDGLLDARDRCPNDPEDKDGFEDENGCSELDNDRDGFFDTHDACPNEPETENGYADEDGCPDEEKVRVVGDRIVLDDRVHFTVNSADIRVQSWPLILKLAKLLADHPEYVLVHIQGHADDTGEEDYNQRLSEARARSVKAMLTRFGIDERRLTVEAFGESQPREIGRTAWARRKNRRVEFVILERRKELADPSLSAAEIDSALGPKAPVRILPERDEGGAP